MQRGECGIETSLALGAPGNSREKMKAAHITACQLWGAKNWRKINFVLSLDPTRLYPRNQSKPEVSQPYPLIGPEKINI